MLRKLFFAIIALAPLFICGCSDGEVRKFRNRLLQIGVEEKYVKLMCADFEKADKRTRAYLMQKVMTQPELFAVQPRPGR